jgi:hypothetical protein
MFPFDQWTVNGTVPVRFAEISTEAPLQMVGLLATTAAVGLGLTVTEALPVAEHPLL